MNKVELADAVEKLLAARRAGTAEAAFDTDSSDLAAPSLDEAYQIQSGVVAAVGEVGGWKTGADSAISVPIAAPIFADRIYPSGTHLPAGSMRLIGLEAELAFRLANDLPPRETLYSEAEFIAAVDCMLPVIELVDSRLLDFEAAGAMWKLADNQINSGLVFAEPIVDWQSLEYSKQQVVLKCAGKFVADGNGWIYPGTPVGLATRLVNSFKDHCGGMRAGQILTLGSLTGIDFVQTADLVTAEFQNLSTVEVTL